MIMSVQKLMIIIEQVIIQANMTLKKKNNQNYIYSPHINTILIKNVTFDENNKQ